jgi:hypothetical protein
MSSKKLYRWIDNNNRKTCLKICQIYYSERPKKTVLFLNYRFLIQVMKRLFFIFINLFRPKKISKHDYNQPQKQVISKQKSLDYLFNKILGLYEFKTPGVVLKSSEDKPLKFKNQLNPLVSIVININHDHDVQHLYNCLQSILLNTGDVAFDILIKIADPGQQIPAFLIQAENITIIETEISTTSVLDENSNIIRSIKGKYLCLIEDNLQVTPFWLSNMLAVFDHQENVTAVVPKVLYPYGLLKEAGGKIKNEILSKYYDDQEDPLHFRYNYLHQTDYFSRFCNLISKEQYAFPENEHKNKFYQPLSEVILSDAYPDQNLVSDNLLPELKTETKAVDESKLRKTILFIDAFLPAYDNNSGSRRIFELIKIFQSLNFEVLFLPADGRKTEPYFSEMINQGIRIIYPIIPYRNPVKELEEVIHEIDIAWISRPELNHFYAPFFKDKPSITWVYDTVDLHFIREERLVKLQNVQTKETAARVNAIKTQEVQLSREANLTIAITDTEAEILLFEGASKVRVIPNVHFPYLGVRNPFEQRQDLCFIGGFHHTPNVDAALWLVKDIMPLVWKSNPNIKLVIMGSNPTSEILALQSSNIEITGYVEDVSGYFTSSRIFVAPLRFGAGMKGKIGHSLEYGLPVITTDIGVEGMELINNQNVLLANTETEFATQILKLYSNKELWEMISSNSLGAIEKFSPARIKERLQEIFIEKR